MWQDVRFGARTLLRSPGVTAAVLLVLALGIGANSAMYTVLDAVLLRSAPFPDPSSLVMLFDRDPDGAAKAVSAASYLDWRKAQSFSDLVGAALSSYVVTGVDHAEQITGAAVTSNFFRALGAKPVLGRTFLPDEDGLDNPVNASKVCVIGYRLWKETLGGDPNILGKTILLNQVPYAVVGVMPADFRFVYRQQQVWVPITLDRTNRTYRYLLVLGRLKVVRTQAVAEMSAMARALEQQYPDTNRSRTILVQDFQEWVVKQGLRSRLLLLAGAVGLILIIACANIANLVLARSAGRSREIAVRVSLGATRARLIRQLLTESVLLAITGGALGLALAYALVRAAPQLLPGYLLTSGSQIEWNLSAVLFNFAASVAAGTLFGLAPSLAFAKTDVQDTLRASSRASTGTRGRQWFRQSMVVWQIGVALMLLSSAVLMIGSFRKQTQTDLGFRPHNVLAWSVFLPSTKYDAGRARRFHEQAVQRIAALPGVDSVGAGSNVPLLGVSMEVPFDFEGAPPRPESERPGVAYVSVTAQYLATLGIPLKRGRGFSDDDNEKAPAVAIVNEAFVRRYFPGRDVVGQHIRLNRPVLGSNEFAPAIPMEIVGVTGNVALNSLGAQPTPILYVPESQNLWRRVNWFVVRTRGDAASLAGAVRHEMERLDSDQPIDQLGTLEQTFADQIAQPRFESGLMSAFAVLALVLAIIGVYGINAHAVAQRRHEIGLRMALGATPSGVLRQILIEGLKLAGIGVVIGIGGTLAIASLLRSVLVGVNPTDPLTLGIVSVALAAIAMAACYLPARRATHIDPAITLRQE